MRESFRIVKEDRVLEAALRLDSIVQQIKPKKPRSREWVRPLWFLSTVGWYVALSIVIPTGIGFWLDRPDKFDSHPLLTLIGFGVGTVLAFYGLYRMLRQFQAEQEEQEKRKEKEQHL